MSFILSKIFWMFVAPANLFALLLLLSVLMIAAQREVWKRRGRVLLGVLVFAIFTLGALPVGSWLIKPLEDRFPPEKPAHVDGIILLAGDEDPRQSMARQQPSMSLSARRYIQFATLAREYPEAKLVFTGGFPELSADEGVSNALVASEVLTGLGLAPERIIYEDKSRNTFENAAYSAKLVNPAKEQNWLLVTSAYHMPRAMECFKAAGWNVYSAATDYFSYDQVDTSYRFSIFEHMMPLHYAVHEYYGLVAYWLMGRIAWPWT